MMNKFNQAISEAGAALMLLTLFIVSPECIEAHATDFGPLTLGQSQVKPRVKPSLRVNIKIAKQQVYGLSGDFIERPVKIANFKMASSMANTHLSNLTGRMMTIIIPTNPSS